MGKKVIVITGSSKGIGFGLAKCFLEEGHDVVLVGTSKESVETAANNLKQYNGKFLAIVCNVTSKESIDNLIKETDSHYDQIDIWINNAGVTHTSASILELEYEEINKVVDINVYGVITASRAIGQYMLEQKFGAIYNMEGLGSDGRIANGSDYYGMTKRMVRYFTRCMAREFKDSGVIIGRLSPGMVFTDLLLKDIDKSPNKESTLKIFRILADNVPVVTEYLSKKILKNKKNDAYIAWLTTRKIIFRFLTAPIIKRNPMG